MRKYPVVLVSIAVLILSISGCAKAPTEEMAAAEAAVKDARDHGAEVYASDTFSEATKALASAGSNVATKKYDAAKNFALQAKQQAESAKQLAIKNKAAAKVKAETAVSEAADALIVAEEALAGAPNGKGAEEDLQQLNLDLEHAKSLFATASQKMDSEEYYAALANAQQVSAEASSIQEAVKIAKENLAKAKEKAPWWMSK